MVLYLLCLFRRGGLYQGTGLLMEKVKQVFKGGKVVMRAALWAFQGCPPVHFVIVSHQPETQQIGLIPGHRFLHVHQYKKQVSGMSQENQSGWFKLETGLITL